MFLIFENKRWTGYVIIDIAKWNYLVVPFRMVHLMNQEVYLEPIQMSMKDHFCKYACVNITYLHLTFF